MLLANCHIDHSCFTKVSMPVESRIEGKTRIYTREEGVTDHPRCVGNESREDNEADQIRMEEAGMRTSNKSGEDNEAG